ncbi:hypothetical protein EDB19DRAFT_1916054 [Suillus lakei]|nr:hypothetical protein EDB19DRAFT_1916054 [Suillus lakei]
MYQYVRQPVDDTPLDDNGQSHLASPSWATSSDLDYQQSHHYSFSNLNFFGHASQSTDTFPDTPFINLHTSNRDRYDLVMAGTDEDPSTSFVDDTFQFALYLHAGYHPMYNPSAIPYQGSGPPHPSPPQYFPIFPPPIVSVDGTSTLAPGSEDILPLGELPRLGKLLPLGDSFDVREPSPPPLHPSTSHSCQPPEKLLEIKFWPYLCCHAPNVFGSENMAFYVEHYSPYHSLCSSSFNSLLLP